MRLARVDKMERSDVLRLCLEVEEDGKACSLLAVGEGGFG